MKHLIVKGLSYACFAAFALGCGGEGAPAQESEDNDETTSSNNTTPGGSNTTNPTGSGGGTSGTTNGGARSGTTECGIQTCSAGQYCNNYICSDGCLSDDNCTGTQSCEKEPGENLGTCQTTRTTPAPSAKDCPGYVQKCVACGGLEELCQRECDVVNAECTSCVINTSGCFLDQCEAPCGR